ncbi:hypothetical protein ACR79M_04915 [Sphingobacterium spiritivorum]|uniref:hypothetical protein n=1 Tax=Sphingobacterium spiritivorum TaxID=258 RepID=UPI003DA34DBE
MRIIAVIFATFILYGCSKTMESGLNKVPISQRGFNLQTLKSFSKQRGLFEKGRGLHKLASLSPDNTVRNFNDLLLWDYAIKEVNTTTDDYSYLVPVQGIQVNSDIGQGIAKKGYRIINFYTDKTKDKVYVRIRDYRPDSAFIDSLSRAKHIPLVNNEYKEYKELLAGEEFTGHIMVYNLNGSPFKLVQAKEGKVINSIQY